MAWNEPGGGDNDPWGGKPTNQGPPELDEIVRKLQEKLGGLFGGGKPPKKDSGGGGMSLPNRAGFGVIGGIVFVVWMASGIYIVEPAERGVEFRFGAFSEVTQPGPHWHWPVPIEDAIEVNVDQISSFRHDAQMLTSDENIIDIELTVQSRIQDAADYLIQDRDPDKTLRDVTETTVREIIGKSQLDFILTEGRGSVQTSIKSSIQTLINQYRTGLEVTSVNMQPAKPPEQVKEAFDDAIKAREDKERIENDAQAYSNEILPKARGAAARIVEDAKAYRARVVAEAEGEASRFAAVLTEYEKAPEVTRERLYLDAVESVLRNNGKVVMDVQGGNNLVYLPLDRLLDNRAGRSTSGVGAKVPTSGSRSAEPGPSPIRRVDRSRRER